MHTLGQGLYGGSDSFGGVVADYAATGTILLVHDVHGGSCHCVESV